MTLVNTTRLNQLRVILDTDKNFPYTDEKLASTALIITRFVVCKERQLLIKYMQKDLTDDIDEQKSL